MEFSTSKGPFLKAISLVGGVANSKTATLPILGNILLETTPKHINMDDVTQAICTEIPEIHQMHDVHIWEITSHMHTMTAHALTTDLRVSQTHDLLERISGLVRERFNICHVNIQFEYQSADESLTSKAIKASTKD